MLYNTTRLVRTLIHTFLGIFEVGPRNLLPHIAHVKNELFITARNRGLRRLCFHRCLSVHRGCGWGVCPNACWDTPPWAGTPPGRYTTLCSACWDTVNKRAVCIPLECILVLFTTGRERLIRTRLIRSST